MYTQVRHVRSTKEVLEILQSKVDQRNSLAMFYAMDESHSGRISVKNLMKGMKQLAIQINEPESEEVVQINERVIRG